MVRGTHPTLLRLLLAPAKQYSCPSPVRGARCRQQGFQAARQTLGVVQVGVEFVGVGVHGSQVKGIFGIIPLLIGGAIRLSIL